MRILAFSVAHDSSVCCLKNGQIEFFCKEERVSGKKRDQVPFKSLEIFKEYNKGQKIDHVLYCTPSNSQKDIEGMFSIYIDKIFENRLENYSDLRHHECHMSLAYCNSKFEEALVFVIDRNGSSFFLNGQEVARECESVFKVSKNSIKELQKNFFITGPTNQKHLFKQAIENYYNCEVNCDSEFSIVKVYEAATTLIGQNPLENGKTMGLSSYSNKNNFESLFNNNIPIGEKFTGSVGPGLGVTFINDYTKITDDVNINNYQFYADKAKHVQLETQEQVLQLIKRHIDTTNIKNVCVVGGYGLNVVANNFLIKNLPDVNFYFEPTADDSGISIGACYLKHFENNGKWSMGVKDNYFHYNSHEDSISGEKCSTDKLSDYLISGKSVALFDKNPEAGPRALGHRSILFDPRKKEAKDIINKIKNREWYRPFAGVILEEKFEEFFETLGYKRSEYMTINFEAKQIAKDIAPGIVHVDGSCRIQTVNDGFLYTLLKDFYNKTGCPILLNTSFNLAGLPLVQTKKDAIRTLRNSSLDYIYFVQEEVLL